MSCDAVEGKPLVHTQEPVQSALRHNRNFKPQEKGESQLESKLRCELEGGDFCFPFICCCLCCPLLLERQGFRDPTLTHSLSVT